jgi:ATP adenylyltransferase
MQGSEELYVESLWAGWRSDYIAGRIDKGPENGCLFCSLALLDDQEALILDRTALTFTIMNAFPYSSGHVMVLPKRHESELTDLTTDEASEIMVAAQRAARVLGATYFPEGLNIGINVGSAGGAGLPEHLHTHVVPRWRSDTNFMASVAQVRVLPESLNESWSRLRDGYAALTASGA